MAGRPWRARLQSGGRLASAVSDCTSVRRDGNGNGNGDNNIGKINDMVQDKEKETEKEKWEVPTD
jgi:hypothetical protein